MRDTVVIDGDLNLTSQIDGEMDTILMVDSGGTKDHSSLFNRDKPGQHPIDAITRLTGELEVRPSEALNNQDIQNILNT